MYIRYATCLTLDFNTKLSNYLFIGRKTEIIQKREEKKKEYDFEERMRELQEEVYYRHRFQ